MKQIETIKSGKNYTAVNMGRLSEVKDYVLPMGPGVEMKGKVFLGQFVGATGSEMSMNSIPAGEGQPFTHTHKTHEEIYIILSGEGEYQVDGEVFPIREGSIVRVAPEGIRSLRNTGSTEMVMLCIQYKANTFSPEDNPMTDGIIQNEQPKW